MKKSIWTKLLVLVLSVTIAVTMTPAFAFANDGEAQDQVVTETSGTTEEDVDATEVEGKLQEDAATEDEGNLPEEDSALDIAGDSANDIPDSGEIMQTQEAGDPAVSYYDMDGKQTTLEGNEYTKISTASSTTLSSGFYVVDKSGEISDRVTISGDVKLILIDGTTLTCSKGITVTGSNNLEIYAQSTGDNAGKLIAIGEKYNSGIGGTDNGYGGTVTICGGTVNATGGEFGAGIGSGDEPGSAAVMTVNIKGGNVTATGGDEAAGIGGGNEGNGATVNISGGTVIANGGNDDYGQGAGIGGGDEGDGGIVTISGGYVKAVGSYRAAGIGGGLKGSNTRTTITGGEVHAFGGGVKNVGTRQSGGAGIGGGAYGYGGVILIRGGDVEAKGVWGGAGLGGGYGCSVTTVAISGDKTKVSANADKGAAAIGGGSGGDAYNISISGGEVDARIITPSSEEAGAAIGSGDSGYVANISITGGTIKAMSDTGNNGAAAIGGGNKGYFGNISIEGGNITAVLAYDGAGIGSGSESEKGADKPLAKITISGGTIRSGAVAQYGYFSTGAGIGSGSHAKSPVNIEISGGNINAYCAMDDGSDNKMEYSGAGIGSGYGSPIGTIDITGGTILARRGNGCTKADPIGYYDNGQDTPYSEIRFNYDSAQIRNEKGEGTDKRVTNTQYDRNDTDLNRIHALIDHETDWVEIKPCDHVDAAYEIVSPGEDGTHKLNCDYCLSGSSEEQVHKFGEDNKCACGYYRYELTFTDGQEGGKSTTAYVYPDLKDGEVETEKEITISDYMPNPMFKVAGKELDGWTIQGDDSGYVYKNEYLYKVKSDTTFVAQWNDLAGVKIVLSSIDGTVAQMRVENMFSEDDRIADFLNDNGVKTGLNHIIANAEKDGYIVEREQYGEQRPKYWASQPLSSYTSLEEFKMDSNATIADLGESHILYVAAFKPIDEVGVSIKTPLCGTETSVSGGMSSNPPEFTVAEGTGYTAVDDPYALLWMNGTTSEDVFEGTMEGDEDYYAVGAGIVSANYGYVFSDNTKVNLDGGNLEGKGVEAQNLSITAKVTADHVWGEWTKTKAPTCSEEGTMMCECTKCNPAAIMAEFIPIDLNAHDWDEATYEWADDYSTCTATRVCNNNDTHVETETVDTTSYIVKEATCKQKGKTRYRAEFKNDAFDAQTKTVENIETNPDAHDWGAWIITKEPTETETGEKTRTCSICGEKQTEVISIEDHVHGLERIKAKAATCTEDGNYEYWVCSEGDHPCNKLFSDKRGENEIAADDIIIEAIGHKYGEWTELDDKQHQRVCERDASHIEKADHVWDEGVVTKEPTTEEDGEKTYTCSDCGAIKTEPIPKKGSDVDPTPTPAPSTQAKTILVAKGIASGKKAIKLSWNNVGADRYVIYMSKCNYKGKKYTQKAVKTVSGNTFKWTKKKLKKKTCYKFYVVAQKKTASGYTTIAKSEEGHAITGNRRGKATNPKSLKLKQTAITLNKGGSATIKGTVKKAKKGKKLLTSHEPLYRYISNNPAVATVAANGKVTAKSSGTAVIYVQTINGIWKTVKVTVK